MKLYEPWVYLKWGVICSLMSVVPPGALPPIGLALFGFGCMLELIERSSPSKQASQETKEIP